MAKTTTKDLGEMFSSTNNFLLELTVSTGVPLRIEEIKQHGYSDFDLEQAQMFANELGEKGDQILYKGKETARLMGKLINAIAIGAFIPGGITFCKQHYEVLNYQDYYNE